MPTPPKSKAAAHFFCFIAWQSDTELGWHWPGPQILFQFQWSALSDLLHCTSIGCLPGRTGDSDPAVLVEALAGDVMAGAGGAAGPAPDVRHQPAGDVFRIQHT